MALKIHFKEKMLKKKNKEIWLKKYKVDNPIKSDVIKEKMKKTCLKKYGVEYSFQSENNKQKSKETFLKKYGADCAMHVPEIKEKVIKSIKLTRKEVAEKAKKTCLEKYKCEKYLFVVDKTEKYKNYIVEKLEKKSHFGNICEYVVLI